MDAPTPNQKVLIISHDIVGSSMAGPGIRYFHFARVIGEQFNVLLAVPHPVEQNLQPFNGQIESYQRNQWDSLVPLLANVTVIILNGYTLVDFPQLADLQIPLVIDGYDPHYAEWLQMTQAVPAEQELGWQPFLAGLAPQYLAGDFYICASERQRDWWLGLLEANGRINPWTVHEDQSLRSLIDVVPYGVPDPHPAGTQPVIRGVWPGISATDKIILWGGGLWMWLDPLTAIRAVAQISERRLDIRLIFPGTRHPNPMMQQIPTRIEAARSLASELGLIDRFVFFGDWLPYQDWPEVLLESDVALSLSAVDSLETHLAYRSRVLEYIWAGLPWISTALDATSELLSKYDMGMIVGFHDVDGLSNAILTLLSRPRSDFQAAFEKARADLSWENVLRPLINYCKQPRLAPDKGRSASGSSIQPVHEMKVALQQEMDNLRKENTHLKIQIDGLQNRRSVRLINWMTHLKIISRIQKTRG